MNQLAEEIEIVDTGAIQRLRIPLAPGGGVTVLQGRNGTGKSTALKAVERMTTDNKAIALASRDGTPRGQVSGLGVTLRVGRSITRTGELEVESLEGRLSVAELVDPGLKDPGAADARRIKALVQLAGVQADPALFHDLVGGPDEFAAITKATVLQTDDILELAGRVKRAIEAACRAREGMQLLAEEKARSHKTSADNVDLSVETDPDVLSQRHHAAIRAQQSLQTRLQQHNEQKATIEKATTSLAELRQAYNGPTSEEAKKAVDKHRELTTETEKRVIALREQLQITQSQLVLRQQEESAANTELRAAQRHEAAIRSWTDTLTSMTEIAAPPLEEDLGKAALDVEQTAAAIEAGIMARKAAEHLASAKSYAEDASRDELAAASLRDAAKSVDDVLSQQIAKLPGCPLKVDSGRLVTETSRGKTLYADLSDGERWKIALDIAIEAVGEGGLLPVPQEAWEGLDPINRKAVADHLKGRGCWILTAEATDDEVITATAI